MPSVITATTAAASVNEGSVAVATYGISPALTVATAVGVSLTGWGTSTADFTGFEYSVNGGAWAVVSGGQVTLTAGATSLQLRTLVNTDNDEWEVGETLEFVVRQLTESGDLVNSWWVASQIGIHNMPASAPATPLAPSTVTVAVVAAVPEGSDAVATFNLSAALGTASDVTVALAEAGGASVADHGGFQYQVVSGATSTAWADVPAGGTLTLPVGATSLKLKTPVSADTVSTEAGESLNFVLQQSASATGLTNSWWVSANIPITDVPVATPPGPVGAATARITADVATTTVAEANAAAGVPVVSTFTLDAALAQDAQVMVGRHGWSAAIDADTTGPMAWRTGNGTTFSAWADVPANGLLTIPAGHTKIELRNQIQDDAQVENTENLVVALVQVSNNLQDSWWVTHTVVITDNDSASTPTALTKVSITAGPATIVNEGQDAVASYTLSGPLAAEAKVNVVALGWDAIPNQDYDGNTLHFRLKVGTTWGNWQTTPNLSEITLAQGTTAFEVKTATLTDTVTPEATETMQFVVSQTAAYSHVLENSWWQSALVGIKDAAYILGSSTGAVTEDGALSASGTLTVFDGDAGEAEFQPLASATGTYGALNLTTAGNWTYTLNNASPAVQALNTGDVRTETFTATSKDGSATQAITVTVNGASDLAVIAGTAIGTVTEDAAQSTATGTLTISDADANEAEFLAQTNQAGAYGLFSVNTAGLWTYTLDNSKPAVQALKGGENKTETFAVSSKDSSAAQAITVTVNGANDVAVISGTTTGTVTEDAAQDTATGLLIITDADAGEAVFQAQTGVMGAYGNFTLNTEGSWTYELDNNKPAVQSLRSNQTVSDVFAVHSLDGFTQRIISIEIIGSSDDVIGVDKLDFNGFTTANPLSVYQGFRMTASSGVLYGSPEAWTAWVVNPSFPGVVYNGNGARFAYLEKVDASNFSIDKLDISQFVSSSPAGDVTFTGYSNNLEIYNQSIHLSSSMQTINLDFENIDVFEVEVNSGPYSGSGWWLIDNIWYV